MSDWADRCHEQGGTVVIPHFPQPNGEPAVLIATGRADAVEMIVQRPMQHAEYYRYLNGGYRVPLVGGTDKMSSDVPVGLVPDVREPRRRAVLVRRLDPCGPRGPNLPERRRRSCASRSTAHGVGDTVHLSGPGHRERRGLGRERAARSRRLQLVRTARWSLEPGALAGAAARAPRRGPGRRRLVARRTVRRSRLLRRSEPPRRVGTPDLRAHLARVRRVRRGRVVPLRPRAGPADAHADRGRVSSASATGGATRRTGSPITTASPTTTRSSSGRSSKPERVRAACNASGPPDRGSNEDRALLGERRRVHARACSRASPSAAEEVGLESLWVSEHLVVADPRTPPSPMDPTDPILEPGDLARVRGGMHDLPPARNRRHRAPAPQPADPREGARDARRAVGRPRSSSGSGSGTSSESSRPSTCLRPARRSGPTSTWTRSGRSGPTSIRPSTATVYAFAGVQSRPRPVQRRIRRSWWGAAPRPSAPPPRGARLVRVGPRSRGHRAPARRVARDRVQGSAGRGTGSPGDHDHPARRRRRRGRGQVRGSRRPPSEPHAPVEGGRTTSRGSSSAWCSLWSSRSGSGPE